MLDFLISLRIVRYMGRWRSYHMVPDTSNKLIWLYVVFSRLHNVAAYDIIHGQIGVNPLSTIIVPIPINGPSAYPSFGLGQGKGYVGRRLGSPPCISPGPLKYHTYDKLKVRYSIV